jgi:hypothetical protein
MLSQLFKQPISVIITLVGCLLIIAGFFKIDDITKLAISPHTQPLYLCIVIGIVMILFGIFIYFVASQSLPMFSISKVENIKSGFSIKHGRLTLNVVFGQIQDFDCSEENCLVALPANEFFDDDCINDSSSALGAYIQCHFKDNISKIQTIVKKELRDQTIENVEKEHGVFGPSYGVGKCVYLNRPLSSNVRIVMTSVTTKRAGEGLRANARYIFAAIDAIHCLMADHRMTCLYLPILGSGHGGLKGEVSLLCMLIAFAQQHSQSLGKHVRSVNIVVYRKDDNAKPSISVKNVKIALRFANELFND